MRDSFGAALAMAGGSCPDVFVLDADCATSTKSALFAERFPNRFANVGISEQNLVGVAGGLAQVGYRVVINSFAAMLAHRAHEQLMQSIGLMESRVLVVGHYAGLSAGEEGAPHHAISDIAVMRAIPGMEVWWPGSDERAGALVYELLDNLTGPAYLRLERNPVPSGALGHRVGPIELWGDAPAEIVVLASGGVVGRCVDAASVDERVVVVGVDRVSPFPAIELAAVLQPARHVVCVEEHGYIGGLASAARDAGVIEPNKLTHLAINGFTETGSQDALIEQNGLDVRNIRRVLASLR